jgi:L-aminopeptidase/D-esterase-like protein
MRWLAEKGIGFPTGVVPVPIVASAILFDLGIGNPQVYPDEHMGYAACQQATTAPPAQGNAGAGMGATAGKILGMNQAMKSGIGTASMRLSGGIVIGALVAVNPLGDVIHPETGKILCGARTLKKGPVQIGKSDSFADTLSVLNSLAGRSILHFASRQNTVIGVVATNAKLSKEQANYVAMMAQDGLAMSIRPAHCLLDGDTLFVMATGEKRTDPNIIGAYSAQVVARAIVNAVLFAQSSGGLPCAADYF